MAKVCDRCRRELDTNKESNLAGQSFELCTSCADHIANHIKNHKPKSGLGSIFGK